VVQMIKDRLSANAVRCSSRVGKGTSSPGSSTS